MIHLHLLLATLAMGTPSPAVTKADKPPAPVWAEIQADPLLTVLQSPAAARWVAVDAGCELRPAADGKSCVFAAAGPGVYRLLVIAGDADPARVAVRVGDLPKPPDPPRPPEPAPTSELGRKFQAAFDADPLPRAERLKVLADTVELYRQAAALATATDVATTGQLVARVREAAKALGLDGLAGLRQEIGRVLSEAMPTDEPMTAAVRERAAKTFNLIRAALQEVK